MASLYGKGTVRVIEPGKKYHLELSGGKCPGANYYLRARETFLGTKRGAELRMAEIRKELELKRGLLEIGIDESELKECGLTIALAIQEGMNIASVKSHITAYRAEQERIASEEKRRITFADWLVDYLSEREKMSEVRKTTLQKDRTHAGHLLKYLGGHYLTNINAEAIKRMYADMRSSGMGDDTLLSCHDLMSRVMVRALEFDRIDANPMVKVKRPKRTREIKRSWLEHDEAARMLKLVTTGEMTSYKMAVYIALSTGARLGEVLGLQWEHLQKTIEGRPYLLIKQQHTRYDERTPTKTSDTGTPEERIVPLDSTTNDVLNKWKAIQRKFLDELCIEQAGSTPIITNSVGNWVTHSNLERWFRGFCVRNGYGKFFTEDGCEIVELTIGDETANLYRSDEYLVLWRDGEGFYCDPNGKRYSRSYKNPYKDLKRRYEGLRFHGLRHTNASILAGCGVDSATIRERLGWKDDRMLARIYGHALQRNLWASVGFMDDLAKDDVQHSEKPFANHLPNSCDLES